MRNATRSLWFSIRTRVALCVLMAAASAEVIHAQLPDSSSVPVRVSTDSAVTKTEILRVVRRHYRYRRQVGLAIFMMLFVATAVTTAQTFNPE